MTVTLNPLVASRIDRPPGRVAGLWVAEDLELLRQGMAGHDWVDASLGGIGAGLDGLALVSDPLGTLVQYGVAWLIEHVRPLTAALDALAGDPGTIAAHARTWHAVSAALTTGSADLDRAARWDVPGWTGPAADAYLEWARGDIARVQALGSGAGVLATATEAAGMIIATVRVLVRDAIAACVGRLVSWAAEELATFGLATPLVIEQVTVFVAGWAARIANWLRALLRSLDRLAALGARAAELLDETRRARPRAEPITADDETALKQYTAYGFVLMNRCLRNPGVCADAVAARIDAVSAALAKLEPHSGITFRGVSLPERVLDRYRPGQVVTDPAFLSTSRTLSVAGDTFGGNALLVIHGRTGRSVAAYSSYPGESEVLFDKGTPFRVLDRVRDHKTGQWIITLEEN